MSFIINGFPGNTIDCADRGLQYGDGLFETIALKEGKLLLWQAHLHRLKQGCERLKIPYIAEELWLKDILQLAILDQNAVIKLIVTRGKGGRGYVAPEKITPTRIVAAYSWPDYAKENTAHGIKLCLCKTRISINESLAGLKHLNRLDNVLARNEWNDDGIMEGLMQDDRDYIIEGTMSNIFAVRNNILYTPLLNRCGIRGVVRSSLMDFCGKNHIEVQEALLKPDELFQMDELFVTNSILGIQPVSALEHHHYSIGPLSLWLIENFNMEADSYAI